MGGGNELSNRHMTECLLDLCGADWSAVRRVPDRKGHDLRYSVNETKIREELGYEPQVPFARGIAETVAWYRDNADWWKAARYKEETDA